MSGRRRRSGRPYQPYPDQRGNWKVRVLVIFVALILVVGFAILTFTR